MNDTMYEVTSQFGAKRRTRERPTSQGVIYPRCYDLPLKFSLPSLSSGALPSFMTPQTNPEPSPTLIFPSALPKLSLPTSAPAPLPAMTMPETIPKTIPLPVIPMPKPRPYQEVYLPFPAPEPRSPTPPIPWSQHTRQYLSMEYLVDQKLENVSSSPETDSPMSDAYPESTIAIPLDWPCQQSIPEPSHVPSPQPMPFDAHPTVPSHRPPLEVNIPEDPPSPASSLGKRSASPSSVVSQPHYMRIWNPERLIHKHSPTYDGAHTIAVPHWRSPPESASASPEASPDASPSISEPTNNASIPNLTLTSILNYISL